MPDVLTPALDLLRRLGLRLPSPVDTTTPKISPDEQNKIVEEDRNKLPNWKQFIQGTLESIAGSSTLDNPKEDLHNPYGYGKTLGELTQIAGIPFPIGKKVFHGSPRMKNIAEEGFDMTRNDPGDTLGWMIHAAESPSYANSYTADYGSYPTGILPLKSDAKNALNAFNPSTEDLARLVSGVGNNVDRYGKSKRNIIIDAYKKGDTDISRGHPIRDVVNYMTPEEFNRTGFDAIKYPDIDQTSWAFPDPYGLRYALSDEIVGGKRIFIGPTKDIELPNGGGILKKSILDDPKYSTPKHSAESDAFGKLSDFIEDPHNYDNTIQGSNNIPYTEPNWIDTTPSQWHNEHKSAIDVASEHAKVAKHPHFGNIDEKEAKDLVNGGEISMGWYEKNFPSKLPNKLVEAK